MEEDAIRPLSSEPTLAPVDSGSVALARGDVVMRAFEEHAGKLTSFAFGMTRDRDVAEDLVQETFLRLVKELAADRPPENIPAWLFRVCPDEAPADVETLRRETNASLHAGLATVPADARAALLMAAQGFSGREIAEAIGRSEMATRTMMFRAREKLRVYLANDEVRS